MPPTSSPVPRLSSAPSAASTVHTLARSPLPSSSAVPVILRHDLVRSFSSVRHSVFLFLVPRSPSCRLNAKPSPAAHYLSRSHHRQGGKGSPRPVLVVIPSPPPHHRSTSNQQLQGSASGCRSSFPPRPLPRLSSPPSGGEGRATSQPGRAIPSSSPCRPSPPCLGVPGHKAVKFCLSSENQGHCRAAGAIFPGRECLQNLFLSLSNHYPKNEAVKSKTEKIQIRIK